MPEQRRLYFDASVYLAFLNNEPDRASVVESLLEEAEQGSVRIFSSTVSLTEVVYLRSLGESLNHAEIDAQIDKLLQNPSITTLIQLTAEIGVMAREFVRSQPARDSALQVRDAIHLATAAQANVDYFCVYDADFHPFREHVDFEIGEPSISSPRMFLPQSE